MSGLNWDSAVEFHLSRLAAERGLAPNSLDSYSRDLAGFSRFCIERDITPEGLDAPALLNYLEHLAERGLGASSQRRHLASVRGLVRELLERKVLAQDPTVAVKLRPALPAFAAHSRGRPDRGPDGDHRYRHAARAARSGDARIGVWKRSAGFGTGQSKIELRLI